MRALLLFLLCFVQLAQAQEFKVNADVRMRYEHREGYGQPRRDSLKAADFVVQRTRINLNYKKDNMEIQISPQNVRVWGESPSGTKVDVNGIQIYQGWLQYHLNSKWRLKVGRQEIERDDARILGNADWNMQGRSHDALVLRFQVDPTHGFDGGIALNSARESNFSEAYTVKNQYKNMQYLGYRGQISHLQWSALFFNQGTAFGQSQIAYNQTTGARLLYSRGAWHVESNAYLQTGKLEEKKVKAYLLSAKAALKLDPSWQTAIGFEYLSGKHQNDFSSVKRSFTPWYGTNHKFNGYMDYFFVGNHANSTGLVDVYGQINYSINKMKWTLYPHWFASAADIYKNEVRMQKYLGTELDVTGSYPVLPELFIHAGFSKIWVSDSLLHLKEGKKSGNHWVFIAVHCQTDLFSNKR
jgi:hypothetical protein